MPFDIPDSELRWSFDTSGGPGGQHANRSNTRVELTFDIADSTAFDDAVRHRLIDRLGHQIRISEAGTRSQMRNRTEAVRRLHEMLDEALSPDPKPRRRTRPSHGARKRRMEQKRARSSLKRQRKAPGVDD